MSDFHFIAQREALAMINDAQEETPTQARHIAGQAAMSDPRAAQLLALFQMSDERGKVTLLAIAGIHAARYPKQGEKA